MKIASILETRGPDASDPYEQGWRSGFRPDAANPYAAGTPEHAKWQDGRDEREAQDKHYDEEVDLSEKLGALRPNLGTGHDVGKSVRKWRKQRGLSESDTQDKTDSNIDEGLKSKLAAAALAGAAAFGGGGAQAQTTAPTGVNATGNNATIVQSLVNPEARQRFVKMHADTTAKLTDPRYTHNPDALAQHQAAPQQQHAEMLQNIKNIEHWQNPYRIIQMAMNMAGVTPKEVLQNLPKGYKLPTTEPKTAPVRLPGDPGYVREGVAEATSDPKFDNMLKGITAKKAVAKQQKTDTKQQSRDAFGSMFGGTSSDLLKNLKIREQGVTEAGSPAQQAAIAIAMKKAGQKPKSLDETCWDGYQQQGMKKKGNRSVPNCVKNEGAERNEMDTPAVQAALARMAQRHGGEKYSKEQLAALGRRLAAAGKQKPVKENDVADFLARGGKITQVKPNRGPRNPGLSLGSRHIGGGGDGARASRTGRGSKPQGKPVVAVESVTKEDIITKLKARLGDYLSDIGQEIRKDPDLINKLAAQAPDDQMGPPVKTVTTDDGHKISIHGNEADGFRISIKNKQSTSKFKNLDEAVMACEMYCAQRRASAESADYIDEAGKDACYHKVKSRYKIWPSAYGSGALVRCRKVGAANWGNSKK